MKKPYMISASGKTTDSTDSSLDRNKSNLVSKLSKAKVSTSMKVNHTDYSASYKIIDETENPTYTAEFSVESTEGWSELRREAISSATEGDVEKYKARFEKNLYLE